MLALGIDTSNYATSLAVVDVRRREVVCALKEFLPVKPGELGLRQSDALFHHTNVLPQMLHKLACACDLTRVAVVGASRQPRGEEGSYMPCFLAGVSAAAAFSAAIGVQPVFTSHQQGHLAAARFGADAPLPAGGDLLFFHVSGGTTELLLTSENTVQCCFGKSLDLYAGQAVDRLGVRLGFGFPAGQAVSDCAEACAEEVSPLPRVALAGMDCHLSGLQNQCERLLAEGKSPGYAAKYCLLAIAETARRMVLAARMACGPLPVLFAGGVMCSMLIRRHLAGLANIAFAPPELSSDNAVGVALIAADNI